MWPKGFRISKKALQETYIERAGSEGKFGGDFQKAEKYEIHGFRFGRIHFGLSFFIYSPAMSGSTIRPPSSQRWLLWSFTLLRQGASLMDPCWNHSIDSEKGPFFKEYRLHKQGSTIYLASNRFFMIQSVESFNSKGHVHWSQNSCHQRGHLSVFQTVKISESFTWPIWLLAMNCLLNLVDELLNDVHIWLQIRYLHPVFRFVWHHVSASPRSLLATSRWDLCQIAQAHSTLLEQSLLAAWELDN